MKVIIHPNKVYFSKHICELLSEDRILRYKVTKEKLILLPNSKDERLRSIKITITKSGIGITNRKAFYQLLNERLCKTTREQEKCFIEGYLSTEKSIIFNFSDVATDFNQDLSGKKFGRLTVIKKTGKKKAYSPYYECICDCGKKRDDILGVYLTSGDTKSCGCLRKEGNISQGGWGSLGIKGVSIDRETGRFRASIHVDGKQIIFSRRKKLKEAILDRKIAERTVDKENKYGNQSKKK